MPHYSTNGRTAFWRAAKGFTATRGSLVFLASFAAGVIGGACDSEDLGGEECIPGYEACPCTDDGLCLQGLTCLSGLCVDAGAADDDDDLPDDDPEDTGNDTPDNPDGECTYDPTCGEFPGMACVPAGFFKMGTDTGDAADGPVRDVCLRTYYIDRTEVPHDAYRACVDAGSCTPPHNGNGCNWLVQGRENHPINCVNWGQAKAYCEWAGKRLPTEAEWEKAARGTDSRMFPWGGDAVTCDRAVTGIGMGSGCGMGSTHPVGSKSPLGDSPYGVADMAGNVREWAYDWWGWYSEHETDNPTGPQTGDHRVQRGAGWSDLDPEDFRTSTHSGAVPDQRDARNGFRCARHP